MRKKAGKTKPRPKQDRAWFEQQVAELGRALEKLPADRQEELKRKLEQERS
jgi:hypothetical protein